MRQILGMGFVYGIFPVQNRGYFCGRVVPVFEAAYPQILADITGPIRISAFPQFDAAVADYTLAEEMKRQRIVIPLTPDSVLVGQGGVFAVRPDSTPFLFRYGRFQLYAELIGDFSLRTKFKIGGTLVLRAS